MLMRVKFSGSGTEDDPYRAPFVSYHQITDVNAQGRAIIFVPPRDDPDDVDEPNTPLRPIIAGKPVLVGLRPAQKLAYRVKLHRRYDRLKGRIDVDAIE